MWRQVGRARQVDAGDPEFNLRGLQGRGGGYKGDNWRMAETAQKTAAAS